MSSEAIPQMWYFAFISFVYSVSLVWIFFRASRQLKSKTIAINISLIIMAFGFVGARLFHVFYENFSFYQKQPASIFYFWQGGFVFYGGALLATFAALIYLHLIKESFLSWADFFAPVLAISYGMGRIACFLNGCCFGELCNLPWAIQGRHPTQLYASLWEILAGAYLLHQEKKMINFIHFQEVQIEKQSHILLSQHNNKPQQGVLFAKGLFLHSMGRLLMEYFRADERGDFLLGFSVSSWISIVLLGISLILLSKKEIKEADSY